MAVTQKELDALTKGPQEAMDDSISTQVPARNRGKRKRTFRTQDAQIVPLDYEQIPLLTTQPMRLGSVNGAVPAGATRFVINVEAQALRYCDSASPTTTYGELWQAGTAFERVLTDLSTVQLVAVTAGAIANVSYYGEQD